MLIALVSPPYAGKHTLAAHLIANHAFTLVTISPTRLSSTPPSLHFESSSAFLTHATLNWRRNYVTMDLREQSQLQEFLKRPFVVVVSILAPIQTRFRRAMFVTSMVERFDFDANLSE